MPDLVRTPSHAGTFYPIGREDCLNQIQKFTKADSGMESCGRLLGGIVPHAGWVYSGRLAAAVIEVISRNLNPGTVVVFGTPHRIQLDRAVIYDQGVWKTPLGDAIVDDALSNEIFLISRNQIVKSRDAHYGEHSIEVQIPLIRYYLPETKIVPILVPPNELAVETGTIIGTVISKKFEKTVVIGSTDLTHYGSKYYGYAPAGSGKSALDWSKQNDMRMVDLILQMQAEAVIPEATSHHNACGAGAIAATIAATKVLGAKSGKLLEHATSQEASPEEFPANFVGYAAIVFCN